MNRRIVTLVPIGSVVIVCSLLIVSSIALKNAPDLGFPSPKASDLYDPNDNFSSATFITSLPRQINSLTLNNMTDTQDYFQLFVDRNYRIIANINWSNSTDIDLYLFDYSYQQLNSSLSSTNLFENVSYKVQNSGMYYIRVQHYSGNSATYSIYVNTVEIPEVDTPPLFLMIFIPIVIAIVAIIIIAAVVHQVNKHKPTHPPTVSPARPLQPTSPSTYSYAPHTAVVEKPMPTDGPVVTVRTCPSCGVQLEPTQRFCQNCGIDLDVKP